MLLVENSASLASACKLKSFIGLSSCNNLQLHSVHASSSKMCKEFNTESVSTVKIILHILPLLLDVKYYFYGDTPDILNVAAENCPEMCNIKDKIDCDNKLKSILNYDFIITVQINL